jgi:hypothetical protein
LTVCVRLAGGVFRNTSLVSIKLLHVPLVSLPPDLLLGPHRLSILLRIDTSVALCYNFGCKIQVTYQLKGSQTRDLTLDFFMNQFPRSPEYPIGNILNCYKNFLSPDTGNKLFTGVPDTGEKLSPVLLLPAIIYCRCL